MRFQRVGGKWGEGSGGAGGLGVPYRPVAMGLRPLGCFGISAPLLWRVHPQPRLPPFGIHHVP